MARFGTLAAEKGAVCRHDQADKKKVHDVEDADAPGDLLRSPRDLLLRVGRFRSSQSGQLGAGVCKRRGDEDAAEAMEAIEECAVRVVPVIKTLVSLPGQ